SAPPGLFGARPGHVVPSRMVTVGMYLFLAALFMLFAAAMLGYILVRTAASEKVALGTLHFPAALWISTVLVVTASFTIHRSLQLLHRERQAGFRNWLGVTLLLAIAFVIVQAPSMAVLLSSQASLKGQHLALYSLIFVLVLVHAMHVIGGIAALSWTSRQARRHVYDHEHYVPIRNVALYWHFLDAVWLVMFFTFLVLG
ncbi:MAG TPA: cytochrome c oxidase subunit 3, partial [Tepidisphaeraceae bacterium]|nr:cytochrome c oxidase subunit 3 [Tepidisphaeraceae bacterium]